MRLRSSSAASAKASSRLAPIRRSKAVSAPERPQLASQRSPAASPACAPGVAPRRGETAARAPPAKALPMSCSLAGRHLRRTTAAFAGRSSCRTPWLGGAPPPRPRRLESHSSSESIRRTGDPVGQAVVDADTSAVRPSLEGPRRRRTTRVGRGPGAWPSRFRRMASARRGPPTAPRARGHGFGGRTPSRPPRPVGRAEGRRRQALPGAGQVSGRASTRLRTPSTVSGRRRGGAPRSPASACGPRSHRTRAAGFACHRHSAAAF